ncbi:MAG: protein translocase subunit SecD [Actinobacteria bacterium]|nr:protein translocase subunit SecD [Actinomycetota bacterium]
MKERRSHFILLALLVGALIAIGLLAVPGSPVQQTPTLGLDLQGGLEVVLEAQPPPGKTLSEEDHARSVEIIRNRIDKLGVSEPEVRKQGENQIVVQLAGVFDINRAVEIIGKTAQLQLYDLQKNLIPGVSSDLQGFPRAHPTLYSILNDGTVKNRAKKGKAAAFYLFDKKNQRIAGPKLTRPEILEGRALIGKKKVPVESLLKDGKLPKEYNLLPLPEKTIVLRCGIDQRYCPGVNEPDPSRTYYYLFRFDPDNKEDPVPEMTGKDIKLNGTRQDFDTSSNQPIVSMQFTDRGGDKFHDITRELAQRGQVAANRNNIDDELAFQQFAIVLDNVIQSAPTIDFNENPDGIPSGNGAQITGIGDLGEAKDLALVLQTGALPVRYSIAERTDVSATLGKDSLRQAYIAALAGLALVAIFLLLFYRFLGLVAVLGLAIYAAFMYAAILLFNVTLTLPGFAGMILTIGVAADANVVIFERIKEESRAGRSVRAAIAAGYAKGFGSIIDANVMTAITALVLFLVASASVKGFALMLLIGTAVSLVTAVGATRAMLGLLSGFRWFDSPKFMGAGGQQTAKWLQIDFMGKRYTWFAISGAVIALAVGAIAIQGLNFGIDFKGGTQITFRATEPVTLSDVRDRAREIGEENAIIQGRGERTGDESYRGFTIKTESLDEAKQAEFETTLKGAYGDDIPYGVKNVSESFGTQIRDQALLAVAFSFVLILLYMAIRFQWKFSLPVLAAIVHDVTIAVGIYALLGKEVTTATVAAILTVLGYSMYDTIIIFDRIRENIPLMRRSSFAMIANVSLWETIRRSLATTFITLLPIGALYFFGGDTLKDFAFALLVGIGSGSYSTIFIAAPLLTIWKEREPEYAARIGQAVDVGKDGTIVLEQAERAQIAEPPSIPELAPVTADLPVKDGDGDGASARSKRQQRRQRRRTRPHGRR